MLWIFDQRFSTSEESLFDWRSNHIASFLKSIVHPLEIQIQNYDGYINRIERRLVLKSLPNLLGYIAEVWIPGWFYKV